MSAPSEAEVDLCSTLSKNGRKREFSKDGTWSVPQKNPQLLLFMSAKVDSEFIFQQRAKLIRKQKRKLIRNLTAAEFLELNHYLGLADAVEVEEMDSNRKRRRDSAT